MNEPKNPLSNIQIASPCSADWNAMIGSERRRFCGECKLNVYNLSKMTRREAENFLINSEGRLCVRFYKRADGTILTKDCPVGWKMIKRRISRAATAFASLIFAAFSGIGLTNYFSKTDEQQLMGTFAPKIENSKENENTFDETNMSVVIPKTPLEENAIMGAPEYILGEDRFYNLKEVKKQLSKKSQR